MAPFAAAHASAGWETRGGVTTGGSLVPRGILTLISMLSTCVTTGDKIWIWELADMLLWDRGKGLERGTLPPILIKFSVLPWFSGVL